MIFFSEETANLEHDATFSRMFSAANGSPAAGLSMFHPGCPTGIPGSSTTASSSAISGRPGHPVVPDAISSLGQPYSADMSHYGPLYYASNYASFKANNRTAPYPRTTADTYYNMYQNFYRSPPVPNTYDTR